jgi:large subunit ribosomal protein L17
MRHKVKGRKLSRTSAHRKATMRALAVALVTSKDKTRVNYTNKIVTTVAKAKELRRFIEPLITRSKEDTLLNRRMVFAALQHKDAVKRLFDVIGPQAKERPGGYTRVIKTGFRQGDGADMAIIELVDFNDVKPEGGKTTKKKRTRRAGKSAAKSTNTAESSAKIEVQNQKDEDIPSTEEKPE